MSSGLANARASSWLLAAGILAFTVADAQEPTPAPAEQDPGFEEQVRQTASTLRCPVCLNLSIEDSPNQLAQEMKQIVRERLAGGESPDEVRAYFVDKYGEWILLTPKPQGINLALWLLPALGLLAGAGVVWVAVRRWVGPPEVGRSDSP